MTFILRLALFAVAMLVQWLLRPKPKSPKPEKVEDMPKTEEGFILPRIYGCVWVTPQIAWWGHTRSKTRGGSGGKK